MFSSINEYKKYLESLNINQLNNEFYFLIDLSSKNKLIMLCLNDDLYSFVNLHKYNDHYEINAATALVKGYGVFCYEAALMTSYPSLVCSDRAISSSDDLNIWNKYMNRSDVDKIEMSENDLVHIENEPIENCQKYWFSKFPEDWFEKLLKNGFHHTDKIEYMKKQARDAWGNY